MTLHSALKFLGDNVNFVPGRRTSIITIQDGYSNDDDRIVRIKYDQINKIKTRNINFYSAGIRAQIREDTRSRVAEELLALAEGNPRHTFYVDGTEFVDALTNLLVYNDILCASQGMKLSK